MKSKKQAVEDAKVREARMPDEPDEEVPAEIVEVADVPDIHVTEIGDVFKEVSEDCYRCVVDMSDDQVLVVEVPSGSSLLYGPKADLIVRAVAIPRAAHEAHVDQGRLRFLHNISGKWEQIA